MLRDHAAHHQAGRRLARRATRQASRPSAAPRVEPLPAAERAAPSRRALMPLIRGMISQRRAQGRPFRRRAGGAGIRQFAARCEQLARARHLLPRSFPAHQDPAAGARLRSGQRDVDDARRRSTRCSRPIATTTPPTTSAASAPNSPGDARPQRGRLSGARRRHDHLRQGQGDGAHRRRVLRQRDQRHARRLDGVDAYVGLPEQEAFDIEYWLLEEAKLQRMPKPKSAGRQDRLVTGGAGGIGRATARAAAAAKAPASCWPTSTRRRSTSASRTLAQGFGSDMRARRAGST